MSQTHLYAYGVIEEESLELDATGVEGVSPVRTIDFRSVSAIVTDIDDMDPERTDENATAHDEVLREVLTYGDGRTVVPMRYGMTFKSARTLKSVLRGGRRAFRKALNDVDGTVELGLKIVAPEDATIDREAITKNVDDHLADVTIEAVDNDLYSDRLVLNRAYLVDRDDQDAFSDAIDEIEAEYDDLTVQYNGPWAPYNFVDIEIGAQ